MSASSDTFKFSLPTKDRGYLAQLQEWANYHHVTLTWGDHTEQVDGITTISSYPIIQGYAYAGFRCSGPSLRAARGYAAEAIIGSPGVLAQARFLLPPPQAAPIRSTRR